MAICKKCCEKFPRSQWIDGKRKSFQNRKYCLKCSPYNKHNTKKLEINDFCVICKICQKEYIYDHKKGHTKNMCNSCYLAKRRLALKIKMVKLKGGKCIKCGYDKCLFALEFHHRNRDEKIFALSSAHYICWEKVKIELDKCDLLCSNCHKEIEWAY